MSMDLRSSSRASRSRSETPFSFFEDKVLKENHVEHSISKSTRKYTTTTTKTGNGKDTIDSTNEEYILNSRYIKPSTRKIRATKIYKTSDYSSEGENEVSSTRSLSDNERNRILEDAKKAADNSSGITALGLYRRAKRYWDEYPKTDWTYSPFSKDRVEIAPGIVAMPNMSRRHISSYDKYTNTESQSSYHNNFSMRPQVLFSERTNQQMERTTVVSFFKKVMFSILMLVVGVFYVSWKSVSFIYKSAHMVSLKFAKNIHRLSSRVMLMDTWLLRKRRNGGKAVSLMVLCLVPLLLLGGCWIVSSMGHQIYGGIFRTSTIPVAVPLDSVEQISTQFPGDPYSGSKQIDYLHHSSEAQKVPFSSNSLTIDQLESISEYVSKNFQMKQHIDYDEIIKKLLNSEPIQKMINNYNIYSQPTSTRTDSELQHKLEQQQLIIDELTNELNKIKRDLVNLQNQEIDMDKLKVDIRKENVHKIDRLVFQLNKCCRKSMNIDSYIFGGLSSLLNNPDFLQKQEGFKNWLNLLFVAKTELEEKLSNLTASLDSKFERSMESSNKVFMDQVVARLNLELGQKYKTTSVVKDPGESDIGLTDQKIREIVKDVLNVYDADKTGLVDYAMEPMGGQVITTRCTESYHTGTAVVSVLGLPLWYPTSSPRTVITPGINPGKCWAFQNYPGLLVIKLMAPIKVEAFSLEHISKLLVPEGKIDSAPKDFEVYGLTHEQDKSGVKIGQYIYDYNGEPLQFFIAQTSEQVFEYIELRVNSNHGNPNYTCLYRFRVHGKKKMNS